MTPPVSGMNENYQREFKAVLPCFTTGNRVNRTYSYSRVTSRQRAESNNGNTHFEPRSQDMFGENPVIMTHMGDTSESNGALVHHDEERHKLIGSKYPNGSYSSYFMGRTENDEEIKFIPVTNVTAV